MWLLFMMALVRHGWCGDPSPQALTLAPDSPPFPHVDLTTHRHPPALTHTETTSNSELSIPKLKLVHLNLTIQGPPPSPQDWLESGRLVFDWNAFLLAHVNVFEMKIKIGPCPTTSKPSFCSLECLGHFWFNSTSAFVVPLELYRNFTFKPGVSHKIWRVGQFLFWKISVNFDCIRNQSCGIHDYVHPFLTHSLPHWQSMVTVWWKFFC